MISETVRIAHRIPASPTNIPNWRKKNLKRLNIAQSKNATRAYLPKKEQIAGAVRVILSLLLNIFIELGLCGNAVFERFGCSFTTFFRQINFAKPDEMRRDLDELVVGDVFQGLFQ